MLLCNQTSQHFAKANSIYFKQLLICPAPVTGDGRSTFYKELSPVSCDTLGGWDGGEDGRTVQEGWDIGIPVADSC